MTARDNRKRKRRATRRLEAWRLRRERPWRLEDMVLVLGERRIAVGTVEIFEQVRVPTYAESILWHKKVWSVSRAPMKCRSMEPVK